MEGVLNVRCGFSSSSVALICRWNLGLVERRGVELASHYLVNVEVGGVSEEDCEGISFVIIILKYFFKKCAFCKPPLIFHESKMIHF